MNFRESTTFIRSNDAQHVVVILFEIIFDAQMSYGHILRRFDF